MSSTTQLNKETKEETESIIDFIQKNDSFIQTYLIISSLLLTHVLQNPLNMLSQDVVSQSAFKSINTNGTGAFIIFLMFILLYKVTPNLTYFLKQNNFITHVLKPLLQNDLITHLLTFLFAAIASFGLGVQVISSINLQILVCNGTDIYYLYTSRTIYQLLSLLVMIIIASTLIPKKDYRYLFIVGFFCTLFVVGSSFL